MLPTPSGLTTPWPHPLQLQLKALSTGSRCLVDLYMPHHWIRTTSFATGSLVRHVLAVILLLTGSCRPQFERYLPVVLCML